MRSAVRLEHRRAQFERGDRERRISRRGRASASWQLRRAIVPHDPNRDWRLGSTSQGDDRPPRDVCAGHRSRLCGCGPGGTTRGRRRKPQPLPGHGNRFPGQPGVADELVRGRTAQAADADPCLRQRRRADPHGLDRGGSRRIRHPGLRSGHRHGPDRPGGDSGHARLLLRGAAARYDDDEHRPHPESRRGAGRPASVRWRVRTVPLLGADDRDLQRHHDRPERARRGRQR